MQVRVLVVDDHRDAAETMGMLVRALGHECRLAYDGHEALAVAEQFLPQLMLLDVSLPGLDGCEVCRRIREQPWGQAIRLVALTGWESGSGRFPLEEAGFDQHQIKPLPLATLQGLLDDVAAGA
jgi:CheY-like chemotaxis protein